MPERPKTSASRRLIDPLRLDVTVRVDKAACVRASTAGNADLRQSDAKAAEQHVRIQSLRAKKFFESGSPDADYWRERAEKAERERDEARRAWCSSQAIMIGDPGDGVPATAAEVAARTGWPYLYPDGEAEEDDAVQGVSL
jgi:hypothetical protein